MNETLEAYKKAGADIGVIGNKEINHIFIRENKVISSNKTDEIDMKVNEDKDGISLNMTVKKGVNLKEPVHLCFGVLEKRKVQNIRINAIFESKSSAKLLAHCIFPNAVDVVHNMEAKITLKEGSSLSYEEVHYHGESGNIEVSPHAEIEMEKGSSYFNKFSLLKGKAGKVRFDYRVSLGDYAKCEMNARINAVKDDDILVKEEAILNGKESSGLLNTRVVLSDESKGMVENTIVGLGDSSRGHMECIEVTNSGSAVAKAVPIVEVRNKTSKITHEAAIGGIDKASLNTLMSRGLTQEEAVKVVINGLLK